MADGIQSISSVCVGGTTPMDKSVDDIDISSMSCVVKVPKACKPFALSELGKDTRHESSPDRWICENLTRKDTHDHETPMDVSLT